MNNNKSAVQKTTSVKTNFIFNLIIQIVTYIIPLITAPYLSRVLSPEGIEYGLIVNSNHN